MSKFAFTSVVLITIGLSSTVWGQGQQRIIVMEATPNQGITYKVLESLGFEFRLTGKGETPDFKPTQTIKPTQKTLDLLKKMMEDNKEVEVNKDGSISFK